MTTPAPKKTKTMPDTRWPADLDWIVGHTFGKYTWLCGKVLPRYAWHESGGRRVCPQSSRQVLAWKQDLKHGFSFTCSSPLLSIIWGCRNATMAEMRFLIMKKFLFHVIPCCTLFVQESGCIGIQCECLMRHKYVKSQNLRSLESFRRSKHGKLSTFLQMTIYSVLRSLSRPAGLCSNTRFSKKGEIFK